MELTPQELGKHIRRLRTEQGLTQEQLADKSKKHFTYIGRIERGEKNISVQSLNDILDALGISFKDFFIPFEQFENDPLEKEIHDKMIIPLLSLCPQDREKIFKLVNIALDLSNSDKSNSQLF